MRFNWRCLYVLEGKIHSCSVEGADVLDAAIFARAFVASRHKIPREPVGAFETAPVVAMVREDQLAVLDAGRWLLELTSLMR